ncbi:hypothetical protein [Sinorhizobium meliloti]|uniref:hypothetical protein n=1 Tax=Rhizobium meliloti TaxID=382 RepID=UPI001296E10C|nr:hypothetical protein [Sinorhizobium meliloti]MQW55268.1 hypothetical protein [Sinorhizobium meliloti]
MNKAARFTARLLLTTFFAAPAAAADSASHHMSENIDEAYTIIKDFIAQKYGRDHPVPPGEAESETPNGEEPGYPLALAQCSTGGDNYVSEGPLRQTLIAIAFMTLVAEQQLSRAKYPPDLWEPALDDFETKALNSVNEGKRLGFEEWPSLENASEEINNNIRTRGMKMRPTTPFSECGGGPARFRIHVEPNSARAMLMPKMMYTYCKTIGKDPSNREACDFWHAPIEHEQWVYLGGVYKLRFQLGANLTPIEEFDFDRYLDGDTVVLRAKH